MRKRIFCNAEVECTEHCNRICGPVREHAVITTALIRLCVVVSFFFFITGRLAKLEAFRVKVEGLVRV